MKGFSPQSSSDNEHKRGEHSSYPSLPKNSPSDGTSPMSRTSPTSRIRKLAIFLGLAVIFLGATVLAGWALNLDALKTVFPGLVTMKANTALCLAFCGLGLALLAQRPFGKYTGPVVTGLAAVAISLGTLTLVQYLAGCDLQIDQMLFRDDFFDKISTSNPGRMAPISALSFVFLGLALGMAARTSPARWHLPLIAALSAAVGMIGAVAFFGCLLKLGTGYLWWDYTGLAAHTAAGFMMLGGGMLAWIKYENALVWSLGPKATGGFALAVMLMVTMAGLTFGFTTKLRDSDRWVSHTHEVLTKIKEVSIQSLELQSQQRGYLITGDPQLLERYGKATENLGQSLCTVRALTRDNPTQQLRINRLAALIAERVHWSDHNIAAYQQDGFVAAQQGISTGQGIALVDQIQSILKEMENEEYRLLSEREILSGPLATTTFLLLPLGVFFSLALLFLGVSLLNADVAARQQAEQTAMRLAAIVDSSFDAIVGKDLQSLVTSWNAGAQRMFGYSAQEMIGHSITRLVSVDRPDDEELLQARIGRGESVEHFETVRMRKDGGLLHVSVTVSPIKDASGRIVGASSVTRDITERKRTEERSAWLATFPERNPNPIIELNLADGIFHYLNFAATWQFPDLKSEGLRHPLVAGLEEMAEMMRETFPKNIEIASAIEPHLWSVLGDATQFHQILLNFCVNARDAMPEGGKLRLETGNIEIDASYASMILDAVPGPHILLEISDTGTGISPENLERIFEPFFTTKGVGNGTGLGLSTVLGIVKSHGGFIQVKSQRGAGTTFQVYLPAAVDHVIAIHPAAPAVPPRGEGQLLLVVDDEPAIAGAACTILESHGYEVLLAGDGVEALALAMPGMDRIAAVLTDIMMPHMDGLALVRTLRKLKPALPVIASTGMGDKLHLAELKTMGIETVLNKPYTANTLLRTIHEALHP